MKSFQMSRYLKKWLPFVIIFLIGMTAVSFMALSHFHRYTASAVIQYLNDGAASGHAADGSELDLSEIYSSANMTQVMENLKLDSTVYSLDELCQSISVEPVLDEQTEAIQAAVNEEGEEYTVEPTVFIVSCTLGAPANDDTVRSILNETLDVYFERYSEQYINSGELNNSTSGIADSDYDYLEMVELIDSAIDDAVENLTLMYSVDEGFRSSASGMSFQDIATEFSMLGRINISRLYAQILSNKITKDQDVLLAKYRNRIAEYGLTQRKADEDIDEVVAIINAYVQKMRESGNTDMDYNYILDEVYDNYVAGEEGEEGTFIDRYVEYDTLLSNLVSYNDEWDYATVDIAYSEYIINVFEDVSGEQIMSGLDGENGEQSAAQSAQATEQQPAALEETAALTAGAESHENEAAELAEANEAENSDIESAAIREMQNTDIVSEAQVYEQIAEVTAAMDRLYETADISNREFNEYLGAQNIDILSSAECHENFNITLLSVACAVIFIVVGCSIAIVLGRFEDIITFMFLTDKNTGCRNRVSCDRYIQAHEDKTVPSSFCAVSVVLKNQVDLNIRLGRKAADLILHRMGMILNNIYGGRANSFIGYNGSGQFWVFYENGPNEDYKTSEYELVSMLKSGMNNDDIRFSVGMANAGAEGVFRLRKLITKASSSAAVYETVNEKEN